MPRSNEIFFSLDLPTGVNPSNDQIEVVKTLAKGLLTLMCNGWNVVDVKHLSLPARTGDAGDLSLKQVAQALGLKTTTPVRQLIHEGKLTHYRAPTTGKLGRIRITRASFDVYVKDLIRQRDLPLSHPDRGLSFLQILTEVIKQNPGGDLDKNPDIIAARKRLPPLEPFSRRRSFK